MAEISYTQEGMVIDGEFIKLEHIVEQCNSIKIKEDKLQLLTMYWRGWRGFDGCTEQIVKTKSKIDTILKYITGKKDILR